MERRSEGDGDMIRLLRVDGVGEEEEGARSSK